LDVSKCPELDVLLAHYNNISNIDELKNLPLSQLIYTEKDINYSIAKAGEKTLSISCIGGGIAVAWLDYYYEYDYDYEDDYDDDYWENWEETYGNYGTIILLPEDGYRFSEFKELHGLDIDEIFSYSYDNESYASFKSTADTMSVTAVFTQRTTNFVDIAEHWAKNDILFVTERGLFSGTSATTFSPNGTMTRGMVVTVLGRYAQADISGFTVSRFSDVAASAYYAPYIEWAAENGIVGGIGGGKFAPDQPITREQMAVILKNFIDKVEIELTAYPDKSSFTDSGKISSWAVDAVNYIKALGIITGLPNGSFNPQGMATRAEVAAIFSRFVRMMDYLDITSFQPATDTDTDAAADTDNTEPVNDENDENTEMPESDE
jgi:hypothetical protein